MQLPVMFKIPVDALFAAKALELLPPVQFPVIFSVPVEMFAAACELVVPVPVPPVQFPVIFSVPLDPLFTARELFTDPVEMFPTMLDMAGAADENCKQSRSVVALLWVTFAVSVTPAFSINNPVPAFETSSQVTSAVMVIVWPVAACASSPTPGTTPPTHVAPALKLPLAADTMSAMAYSPFAVR
jgi:hypothetical protein